MLRVCSQEMLPRGLIRSMGVGGDQLRDCFGASEIDPAIQKGETREFAGVGGARSRPEQFVEDQLHHHPSTMTEYFHLLETGVGVTRRHGDSSDLIDQFGRGVTKAAITEMKVLEGLNVS